MISKHPTWNIAHLAVQLQLMDCLSDPKVIEAFLQADPNDGKSPLQLAIETENLKIIKHLLANGAPIDHFDAQYNSCFHYAAVTNKKVILMLLEQSTSTLNTKNLLGQTPLHVACHKDRKECVLALLEAGADVNITLENNGGGEPGLVGNVLQKHSSEFSPDDIKSGGTPLHWSCSQEVISALVEKKCDVNSLNFDKRTALHVSIK